MTSPTPPPEEPAQQPPTSPQVADVEAALAAAEDSLAPIIAALLVAAAAQQATPNTGSGSIFGGTSGELLKGALFTPAWVANTFANSVTETTKAALMLLLHPIVLGQLQTLKTYAPTPPPYGAGPDLNSVAHTSTEHAVNHAAEQLAGKAGTTTPHDIYDLFETDDTDDDPRSLTQKRAETFARRTARWLAREAVFHAQTAVADAFGFTHKRWVTEADNRVRTEHTKLHGRATTITGSFRTEFGPIRYPGDIRAPIHMTAGCRCHLEWLRRR